MRGYQQQVRDDVRERAEELSGKKLSVDELINFAIHFRNRERALRRKRKKPNPSKL